MICLRIGRVLAEDRPDRRARLLGLVQPARRGQHDRRAASSRAGQRALRRVLRVSDNRWSYRDLEHPETVLGWTPLDRAEDHRR